MTCSPANNKLKEEKEWHFFMARNQAVTGSLILSDTFQGGKREKAHELKHFATASS